MFVNDNVNANDNVVPADVAVVAAAAVVVVVVAGCGGGGGGGGAIPAGPPKLNRTGHEYLEHKETTHLPYPNLLFSR